MSVDLVFLIRTYWYVLILSNNDFFGIAQKTQMLFQIVTQFLGCISIGDRDFDADLRLNRLHTEITSLPLVVFIMYFIQR